MIAQRIMRSYMHDCPQIANCWTRGAERRHTTPKPVTQGLHVVGGKLLINLLTEGWPGWVDLDTA